MIAALLVALGGLAGASARHLLGERLDARTRDTLAVNVLGSFILGLLLGVGVGTTGTHLLATGFCGSFTTFSTFAFETVRLAETGESRAAAVYAVVSIGAALAAVGVGAVLGGRLS